MGAHGYRHRQEVADDRADAPTLRVIRQVQDLETDQNVVGQDRDGVEGLIGHQILTGRMVQIQAGEHFAEALLFGPFEPVALKDSLRTVLVPRLAHPIGVAPHQLALLLPTHRRKLLHLLALSRLVLDPSVLLLRLIDRRQRTPLARGQLGGQAVQFIGPLVVADAPTTKPSALNPVEVFAGARTAVGVEVIGAALPAMLMLVEQHR